MKKISPLDWQRLCTHCDPKQFTFTNTSELKNLDDVIGQERALAALHFGISIQREGYNIYALGPLGIGKYTVTHSILKQHAQQQASADDWCYLYHFSDPQKPIAVSLTAGWGQKLKQDMESLIEELQNSISALLESDEYHAQIKKIDEELKKKEERILRNLQEEAKNNGLTILSTQQGFVVVPTSRSKVITGEEFNQLSPIKRKEKVKKIAIIRDRLTKLLEQIPRWYKEKQKIKKAQQKEWVSPIINHLIQRLKKKYQQFEKVIAYLEAVQKDMMKNLKDFYRFEKKDKNILTPRDPEKNPFLRYQVNIFIDQSKIKGAPIIYEDNPTYDNLIGRMEYEAHLGALTTNFTLIYPGALHRANGGYLILDAPKVLSQPYAWEGLTRALRAHQVTIEPLGQAMGLLSTVSLQPEPIPLKIKVILLGERDIYYLLCAMDANFYELFKVAADFDYCTPRNQKNVQLYARWIATLTRKENLRPIHRTAVAHIIDHTTRLISDTKKLFIHLRSLTDLIREADYWASHSQLKMIEVQDIKQAIQHQHYRLNRFQKRIYEQIQRGTLLVNTKGSIQGQVNSLTIVDVGEFTFGFPCRVTATVRLGKGDIINIEREVELSGPLHSKGILILSGFLGSRYAKEIPLSLHASIVFEQNYNNVDGDSASLAELCALLSAIANLPIKQSLAVTGSVNQHGQVQPVGGINEKIEGFFSICAAKGLTGEQGVIIPAPNIQNLMLNESVVTATKENLFYIYPVKTVDETISLLMGIPAGKPNKIGAYPKGSVNERIQQYLKKLTQLSEQIEK